MAPSSSPHSHSSPRKLLKTDPKPKPVVDPPAAPLNSASSSSTTTIPPAEKRTRDQPNLSDCHCCCRRINHTNPKDRLQPLDSIWRIVLLCRKCRKKVNSGQTCPYCFKETEHSGNLFRCSVCHRKIHKDCVKDYCAPWCYLVADLGFRVCLDCWVPDSLKNSIRTCGRSESKDASKCKGEAKDFSEKTVKDASGEVEKVKMAVNDKDQALKKATVTKNSASNAKHVLDLVRKKDRDEHKGASSDCSGKIKGVDDAELAFRLHRAMNSSPRILRDKCRVNSCSDDLKNGNSNGRSCRRLVLGGDNSESQSANSREIDRNYWTDKKSLYSDATELAVGPFMYKREKKRKTWQEVRLQLKDSETGRPFKWNDDICGILFCVSSHQSGSCININRFGQDPAVYKRTRFRRKACKGNDIVEFSAFDNLTATFESQNHQSDVTHQLPLVEPGTVCEARCTTEESLPNGNCNAEHDRYFLKYARTDRGFKCGDKVIFPYGSCYAESDRYFVKYSKRIKGTKSGPTEPGFDTFLSSKQPCGPCLSDSQAGYSENCDGEFNLPHDGNDEESDRYLFKYVKRMKGSQSGSVVES